MRSAAYPTSGCQALVLLECCPDKSLLLQQPFFPPNVLFSSQQCRPIKPQRSGRTKPTGFCNRNYSLLSCVPSAFLKCCYYKTKQHALQTGVTLPALFISSCNCAILKFSSFPMPFPQTNTSQSYKITETSPIWLGASQATCNISD